MYTSYFGLREKPFSLIPDGESIFFSPGHRAAFSMLEFGLLEQVGITVITGEVGSGKTTLIRHLLSRINYDELTVGLIGTAHKSYGTLLKWIINAFRIREQSSDESLLLQTLQDFLIDQYADGKRTVVIVDEAQNMDNSDLESLRLLTNINSDKNQLLQVILVGQPELLKKFYEPGMSQLAQRVSAEYTLNPLNLFETMGYICYRVEQAGCTRELFDVSSLLAIYYYSGGIPRVINTLCDGALVYAYGSDKDTVNMDIVLDVVKAKQIGGIHRPGIDTDPNRETVRADVLKMRGVDLLDLVG
ncbi:MAG: AAA family ATPase [Pseudomonadales bacterium]|nr:AAA family ATPase [Halioglobus sp.]MCP5192095.1 AAA family ATPase [Pseudomonadales bacterium]